MGMYEGEGCVYLRGGGSHRDNVCKCWGQSVGGTGSIPHRLHRDGDQRDVTRRRGQVLIQGVDPGLGRC